MTKRRGSRNYNEEEVKLLLKLVATHVPKVIAEWEALAVIYNRNKSSGMAARDAISLQRKSRCLCARNRQASSVEAVRSSGISSGTVSMAKDVTKNKELWHLPKPQEKANNHQRHTATPTAQMGTFITSQRKISPKRQPPFDELRPWFKRQEEQFDEQVLGLPRRRLCHILKKPRQAERRNRRALRSCIESLTAEIEHASTQTNQER
ncbi:hypothetical protein PHMEG_00020381 [Phytophthora megakarya]|uniref:DUF6818 domain-containing protein n=1 Tax=Phytophthora megakarya TaxID=4795 RepID=A0A225VNX8_9STRA|nr:hypothetical protein PHMEG_00020381 [Phytophthora megakarya]